MLKLTAPQRRLLAEVARSLDNYDGLAPHGAGEFRTIQGLIKLKLVRFVAFGECGDGCERAGDCPHPVQIYTLTDAGRIEAQERAA